MRSFHTVRQRIYDKFIIATFLIPVKGFAKNMKKMKCFCDLADWFSFQSMAERKFSGTSGGDVSKNYA